MQERLLQSLLLEHDLPLLLTDLKHDTVNEKSALYLIINAIPPCTLNLENRVGLKLFTRLLFTISLDRDRLGDFPGLTVMQAVKEAD